MKKIKALLMTSVFFFASSAYAAKDPFAAADNIAQKILDGLTGKLAITIISLFIVFIGYQLINGNIQKKRGFEIIGGTILIYGAAKFAAFLVSN